MRCRIILMSDVAEKFLQAVSTGTVHSVYRKTINLVADGRLLSLQAEDSVLSPISLITDLSSDAMSKLWVQQGDMVHFGRDDIKLQNSEFLFTAAQRINLSCLSPLSNLDIDLLHYNIKISISHADTAGFDNIFIGNIQSPALEYAHNYMYKCKIAFLAENYSDAAASLCRLIGLGQGLTPSGDDFLCGVLAGLTLTDRGSSPFAIKLRQTVQDSLTNTNDISRAFLQCAIDNQYSQPVIELAKPQSHHEILAAFKAIGHSSGIDTLCGILYALELCSGE